MNLHELTKCQETLRTISEGVDELLPKVDSLRAALDSAKEAYEQLPDVDTLGEITSSAVKLAGSLESAKDAYESLPESF